MRSGIGAGSIFCLSFSLSDRVSFYFLVRILKDIFFLHSILDLNGVINVLKFAVSATAHTNLAKKSCFMTECAVF